MANARMLSEGVDVPELDGVLFADSRSSPIDVVQAASRALRLGSDPDKVATIVIPVLVRAGEDPSAVLESSAFDVVWQVVRGLRSHDERLADWLDESRVRLTRGDPHQPGKPLAPPHWLVLHGTPVTRAFADAITVHAVETGSSSWWQTYALAGDFYARTGHLMPTLADDPQLYHFVTTSRVQDNAQRLAADRRAALDRIGMVWDVYAARWDEFLAACDIYRQKFGDLHVSQKFRLVNDRFPEPGYPLGSRINTARANPSRVPGHIRDSLDRWGFAWSVPDAKFAELLIHVRHWTEHNGTSDPRENDMCCGYFPLEARLRQKRDTFRHGRLSTVQRDALEKAGVALIKQDPRVAMLLAACDRWLDQQRKAGVTCPRLDVPKGYVDSAGYQLYRTITYYRVLNSRSQKEQSSAGNEVNPEIRAELDRRGMIWRVKPDFRPATAAEIEDLSQRPEKEQTQEILNLVDQMVTVTSIAGALGIKETTLRARIARARTPRASRRPRAVTSAEMNTVRQLAGLDQTKAIIELVDQKISMTSIANELALPLVTLSARIRKARARQAEPTPSGEPEAAPQLLFTHPEPQPEPAARTGRPASILTFLSPDS